jgi:hypothetical protein
MSMPRPWIQILNPILFILILISPVQADNSNKEVLPVSSMSGIIKGTFEPGKLLLSSNDKIVIDLIEVYGIKPGDYVEIYQPLVPEVKEDGIALFRKIGLGIIIEKIGEKQAVCLIDSSIKEISVGDLVYLGNRRKRLLGFD